MTSPSAGVNDLLKRGASMAKDARTKARPVVTAAMRRMPRVRLPFAPQRMTPGYLLVGTKRGGTTSLADWIEQHPDVAPCRSPKGTHYFDVNYGRGPLWFRSRFERVDRGYAITGEASPYYMFHPAAPTRIKQELPDVKLILMLRDPVERAWSHFDYERRHGVETETSFESALDLEPQRLAGEVERLLADESYSGFRYRHLGYLARGHYDEQLAHLHELFDPAQVLVLQSEAVFADPATQLDKVWDHLGIRRVQLGGLQARNANPKPSPIDPAVRQRLVDYYEPHLERLYALPGVDFRWERA